MRRSLLLAGLAGLLCSCSVNTTSTAPTPEPTPPCRPLVALPTGSGPPPALIHDLAAGPYEYLLGHPGSPVARLDTTGSTNIPRLAGGVVLQSVGGGTTQEVYAGAPGTCARRIARGTLGEVDRTGRALTIISTNRYVLADMNGKELAKLDSAAGHFTPDGHFIQPNQGKITVYDLRGKRREFKGEGVVQPLGPLGPNQEMIVGSSAAVLLLNVETMTTTPLGKTASDLRFPSGSPDGNHIASINAAGDGQVLDLRTGKLLDLPHPGPTTGLLWSADSQWLALQTLFGGVVIHVEDGRSIDLGPLAVVSW